MTPVVRVLLIINIALFAAEELLALPEISHYLALYNISSANFQPYQYITHAFIHGNFGHLLSNMIGLFFFGPFIEQQLNSKRFLQLYMVCAIGAGLLQSGISFYESKQLENRLVEVIQPPTPSKVHSFISSIQEVEISWVKQKRRHLLESEELLTDENRDIINAYLNDPTNEKKTDEAKSSVAKTAKRPRLRDSSRRSMCWKPSYKRKMRC